MTASSMLVGVTVLAAVVAICGADIVAAQDASAPPRGWNSYDSYTWIINETAFLANAEYQAKHLLQHGYEYAVIDYLWYLDLNGETLYIDEYGRPIPDVHRWPSSANGNGFKTVADKVHALGLKFGIHIMRGITTTALAANAPIKGGGGARAVDIALPQDKCPWESKFMSVNVSTFAGQAFEQSLYDQYASWGVDFIKNDCMFGGNFVPLQIEAVSKAIASSSRNMVYSLSPGDKATPAMAREIDAAVNMYRVTGDMWDHWSNILAHFETAATFTQAGLDGAKGKGGLSWPDLDMLPLGYISSPGSSQGPYRMTSLTHDEQVTLMTLWAISKSPLIYGGDMLRMDPWTLSLLTNSEVLAMNAHGVQQTPIAAPSGGTTGETYAWSSRCADGSCYYLAMFNAGTASATLTSPFAAMGKGAPSSCGSVTNVWTGAALGAHSSSFTATVPSHGTTLVKMTQCSTQN